MESRGWWSVEGEGWLRVEGGGWRVESLGWRRRMWQAFTQGATHAGFNSSFSVASKTQLCCDFICSEATHQGVTDVRRTRVFRGRI